MSREKIKKNQQIATSFSQFAASCDKFLQVFNKFRKFFNKHKNSEDSDQLPEVS